MGTRAVLMIVHRNLLCPGRAQFHLQLLGVEGWAGGPSEMEQRKPTLKGSRVQRRPGGGVGWGDRWAGIS